MGSSLGLSEPCRPISGPSIASCVDYENDAEMAKGEKALANVDESTFISSHLRVSGPRCMS